MMITLLSLAWSMFAPLAGAQSLPVGPSLTILNWHDIRDDSAAVARSVDTTQVSTGELIRQLETIRTLGFTPISLQQWIDARNGQATLPAHPLLLTFDDGFASLYTKVFPLLRLYGYPAVVAIVGQWVAAGKGANGDFCTWEQLREMVDSGLIEVASHSHGLHRGMVANPQGNEQPATTARRFSDNRYEDEAAYHERLRADLAASADLIERQLGLRPRAIAWPYGAYNDAALQAARAAGHTVAMNLDAGVTPLDGSLLHLRRTLVESTMNATDFARLLVERPAAPIAALGTLRTVHLSLDPVRDDDSAIQERNLSTMLERVRRLGVNAVILDAFADADHDGRADALYFPNRHMTMRSDLFNRAAWQLRTRVNVKVFAQLPLLGFDWQVPEPTTGAGPASSSNPLDADSRRRIFEVYEDLARHSQFAGIVFYDPPPDVDSRPWVPREADALADSRVDTRINAPTARDLDDLAADIGRLLRGYQPGLLTVRQIDLPAALAVAKPKRPNPELEQRLARFDYLLATATPDTKTTPLKPWMRRIVTMLHDTPQAFDRTLIELLDDDTDPAAQVPDADSLHASVDPDIGYPRLPVRLNWLLEAGVRHVGYSQDNFASDQPSLSDMRPLVSTATQFNPRR